VGATLEHLSVGGFDVRYVDGHGQPAAARVDWAAAFANATALHSLDIEGSHGVDELLPVIGAHCVQLQSLRIRFAWLTPHAAFGSMAPSTAVLAALFAALPSLRSVVLSMRHRAAYAHADPTRNRTAMAGEWQLVHTDLSAFAALHPQRVRLRLE